MKQSRTSVCSFKLKIHYWFLFTLAPLLSTTPVAAQQWQSAFVKLENGRLKYTADEKGNTIPDFSRVGYHQNRKELPQVTVVETVSPDGNHDQALIQQAVDAVAKRTPDAQGIRGAVLLKAGTYKIPGSIRIETSGIVLRGEGEQTRLLATGAYKHSTVVASGKGNLAEVPGSRVRITDAYVPVGAKHFNVAAGHGLRPGDKIVLYRPATTNWIHDLKMDQIEPGEGTIQWITNDYNLTFERVVTVVKGNTIFIDNPVVMAMEEGYGGGEVFKYIFDGRISEVGIENLLLESEYNGETDENHGWDAISFNKIEDSWISGVTSRFFGYSCVNLGHASKQITVRDSKCLAPKSQIIGGRRYSFNNDGQLNLFVNCYASEGRHDYVTGAKVSGPNVFYNCKSENAKADIGPHHRWAMGTLYDNIVTDGEINIQDRGNWGTGHGWAGVNQVLWNCTAAQVTVQNPYVSGKNYAIGVKGKKKNGRLSGRPDGVWEGQNKNGLIPASLYVKQVEESK